MKRIILSLLTLGIVAVVATGATTALLSDEEVSTGNTFTAGAVDLGVDNHSYYNGNECALVDDGEDGEWQWVGDNPYPVPGTPCETTWEVDYDIEHNAEGETEVRRFFAFDDLKPGDWGEDTISLHVDNNDAFLCVDVTLTSDDDNGLTEPEGNDGDTTGGVGEGELADALIFVWWADDGDNVYEDDEILLPAGPLGAIEVDETATIALADSEQNIWNENLEAGSVPGDETLYIGKAWCFGDLTMSPVAQDGETDGSVNNPSVDPGFSCNGAPVDNVTQTDSATLDISFQAVQARHNSDFFCVEQPRDNGNLTVTKIVEGGPLAVENFDLYAGGELLMSGVEEEVTAGDIVVSEVDDSGLYTAVIGGECDSNGDITIDIDGTHSCTITNTYDPGSVTIDKSVSFTGSGVAINIANFELFIDDGVNGPIQLTDQTTMTDLPAGTYTVTEDYVGGFDISYDAVFSGDCSDEGQTGTITLGNGDDLTCFLENEITVNPV